MRGNYVCQDYFADVADVLREDFRRVTPPSAHGSGIAAAVAAARDSGAAPVAVHVRRGDYAHEAHVNQAHGLCTEAYYARAFALLRRLVDNPRFFVFSNDPDWAASHFNDPSLTVVMTPPDEAPVEDLMLMASCDHHIIANSGYSWWGAWLAHSPGQVVVGPRPFMADRSLNTEDIMPRHWISLGTQPELRPV